MCVCVYVRSEEHTSELQSHLNIVCRLLLEKKKRCNTSAAACVAFSALVRGAARVLARRECREHDLRGAPLEEVAAGVLWCRFFFFNDTATTEIYTLSLHDALPI